MSGQGHTGRPEKYQHLKIAKASKRIVAMSAEIPSIEALQAFVDESLGSYTWSSKVKVGKVTVVFDIRTREPLIAWEGHRTADIKLPPGYRNKPTVLRMLSHIWVPKRYASHGSAYARRYLKMVRYFLGPEFAGVLEADFLKFGVIYKGRAT